MNSPADIGSMMNADCGQTQMVSSSTTLTSSTQNTALVHAEAEYGLDEYRASFPLYASHLLRVRDKGARLSPFLLNPVQAEVDRLLNFHIKRHRCLMLILKARQTGICLDPKTPILTDEFKWITLDEVKVGQGLIAFDEETIPRDGKKNLTRRFKRAVVESKRELIAPVRRIVYEGGEIIATHEHRLLGKKSQDNMVWIKAGALRVGDTLRHIVSPWEAQDLNDAWMGGILDGEGHLRNRNREKSGSGCQLGVTQAEGPLLDEIVRYFDDKGYQYHHRDDKPHGYGHKQVHQLSVNRITEIFKIIGQCQPRRFNKGSWWEGIALPGKRIGIPKGRILAIEELGPQRVIDLQTSCKTFIANGIGSHNSTWAEGRLFHLAHLWPNMRNAILAHDFSGAENVYNMSRLFLDQLPIEWRPLTKYSSKQQIVFENPHKHNRDINPGLKSRMDVFTAGRTTSGRSFTFTCLHVSEFMYIQNGAEIMGSLIPALPNAPGRFMILESTANGTDNFGYEYWKMFNEVHDRYKENSEFVPVFIAWFHMPEYSQPFFSVDQRRMFEADMDNDDRAVMTRFGLSLEQMHWRRNQITAMGNDVDMFMQEYPSTADEAFLSSGRPVFRQSDLRLVMEGIRPPDFIGEIGHRGELTENHRGRLKIWSRPAPGHEYVIGVDPIGEGGANTPTRSGRGDNAVIQVLEKSTLTQVAEWVDRIEPIAMAPYVRELGRMYGGTDLKGRRSGDAFVIPETNVGMSLVYELNKDYYNIYRREVLDSNQYKITDKLGWRTDVRTKPMLVDFATFCFHSHYCKINSIDLLNEMRTFVFNPDSAAAEGSNKDDRVLAWMLALFAAGKDRASFHPHLFVDPDVEKSRVRTIEQKLSDRIDGATVDLEHWRELTGRTVPYQNWIEY